MEKTVLWQGIEYHSLEHCIVTKATSSIKVNSVIVGKYGSDIYRVEYNIDTNPNGAVVFFRLKTHVNDRAEEVIFTSDGKGNWYWEGQSLNAFAGCIDVDITLTPFTNTLPVNRLNLDIGAPHRIKVLYCDILEGNFTVAHQKYTRLSAEKYKFENVPNDFEAIIDVDEVGLVKQYPSLFRRIE